MDKMTTYQQNLVVENLGIVDWVIRCRIRVSKMPLFTYEDFYQIGCEALCRAAMAYRQELGDFTPLGGRYVYNAIIDHCRKYGRDASRMVDLDLDSDNDGMIMLYARSEVNMFDAITEKVLLKALTDCKERYSGITRNGIIAMEMRYRGFTPKEIADSFGTNTNNVNAWIARARAKLRNDPAFCAALA